MLALFGLAEFVVGLDLFDDETKIRIDGARRCEDRVRPEHQFGIARAARQSDAAPDEIAAETMAPRRGVDIEQAQPRHAVRLGDEEDAAEQFAMPFGDPALFAAGLKIANEVAPGLTDHHLHRIPPSLGVA